MQTMFRRSQISVFGFVLILAIASTATVRAQSMTTQQKINVTLPYSVMVGDKVLQQGDYTMTEVTQNTIQFVNKSNPDGPKVEATYSSIPAETNKTPKKLAWFSAS